MSHNLLSRENIVPACLVIITLMALMVIFFYMKPVLVPFVFAIFLYFVVSPLTDWFVAKLRLPRGLAIGASFLFLVAFLGVFITILGVSISSFIESSGIYRDKLIRIFDEMVLMLNGYGIEMDLSIFRRYLSNLPILDWVKNVSGGVFSIIGNTMLVLIFTFFLILGAPEKNEGGVFSQEVNHRITRYIMVKFFTSSLTALLTWIVLISFDVELASTFAVLTFLLNFIPNIGSIIATSLPLPLVFLQYGFGIKFFFVFVISVIIQFGIGNILDPKLMGHNLGLHPVVVLLALLFWGFLWGVPGLFLSVPITAVIKLLLDRSLITSRFARIMEGTLY